MTGWEDAFVSRVEGWLWSSSSSGSSPDDFPIDLLKSDQSHFLEYLNLPLRAIKIRSRSALSCADWLGLRAVEVELGPGAELFVPDADGKVRVDQNQENGRLAIHQ
jgi:hypothetical protein